MPRVDLTILTTRDISAPESGRRIGAIIQECAPDLFPDRIGNWEPITNPCSSPEDFARFWSWPVLAKRRKPRGDISVWFRKPHRKYSAIHLGIASNMRVTSDLSKLLAQMAALTDAEFGMAQTLSDTYRERADSRGLLSYINKKKTLFFLSLSDEELAQGLPDAFDVMWLPDREWIIHATDLIRTPVGVYALKSGDSSVRDDVLRGVLRRANEDGAANRSQPVGPQTNGTSAAAGSRR